MTSFIMKVFMCPIAVILAALLFPNVEYGTYYQAIITGLIIAGAGALMEFMLLRRGTEALSTALDFVAATLIVYFVSNTFTGAEVTFFGAVLTGLIIGVVEHFVHLWLVRTGKTVKSPA